MVIVDTNIIIDHIRQKNANKISLLSTLIEKEGLENIGISVFTLQELYMGKSTLVLKKELDLLRLINSLIIFSYHVDTATLAGRLSRDIGSSLSFVDAALVATCLSNNCSLVTLNTKHFQGIPGLNLYSL